VSEEGAKNLPGESRVKFKEKYLALFPDLPIKYSKLIVPSPFGRMPLCCNMRVLSMEIGCFFLPVISTISFQGWNPYRMISKATLPGK